MKHCYKLIFVPAALLALAACVKEETGENTLPESANVVSFVLGGDNVVTKSADGAPAASYAIEGVEKAEGLALVETVSSMDEMFAPAEVGTKGAPVYNENFDNLYGTQLYATAYEPKTGSAQLTDPWGSGLGSHGTVKLENKDKLTYSFDYGSLAWPAGGELRYFLQAPYDKTKDLSPEFWSDGSIRFDYTDPAYVSGTAIANAAASQTDVLFASKVISKSESSNSILMYHALTGVKFQIGNDDPEGVKTSITKVTIKDIASKGHCTITPADGSKSSACSVWSGLSQEVTYSQEFSGVVDYTKENSNFSDSFYARNNLKNLGSTTDGSEILMMVPQKKDAVELTVDFTVKIGDADPVPYERTIKFNVDWKAGELHTYRLTVTNVEVSVDDEMDEVKEVKSDVETRNNGNVTAYLRAALSLAWYYGDAAVAAYAGDSDGVFEGLTTDWIKGNDGFYYYKYPVKAGQETNSPIFDKFTAKTPEKVPFAEAHLEMTILLQGVQFDAAKEKVTAAWGKEIADQLENVPEE